MIFKKNWKSSRPSPQDPEGTPDLWSLPDRFSPKDTKLAQLSGVVTPVTKIDWHVKRRAVSMNIMFKLPIVHLLWRNLYYVWHRYRYSNVSQVTMWEGFLGWLLLSTGMTDSLRVNLPTLSIVLSKRKSKTRLLMTMENWWRSDNLVTRWQCWLSQIIWGWRRGWGGKGRSGFWTALQDFQEIFHLSFCQFRVRCYSIFHNILMSCYCQ